jgi:hypothetical protein
VLPSVKYSPMHFVDCYHKMAGITLTREGEKLITSPSHNASAFANMSTIRKTLGGTDGATKVIGIQLKTSDTTKDIPEEIIHGLITQMRETNELIPIILIAPTEEERRIAIELNDKFNNELAIVEADLQAIASVLMNLDLLVTPDTAIKHIADLTDTPVLEISLGHAPFLKQGTYSAGSLVLTDIIIDRNFNAGETAQSTKITAQDITSSILYFFAKTKNIRPRLSSNITLYACSFDQLGAKYSVVAGSVNPQTEILRLMSRQLINSLFEQNDTIENYTEATDYGSIPASTWCQSEKANLTNVMKDLLGTLRSLIQGQESRSNSKEFVINLGKLITHSENNSFLQIPLMMFKAKIEAISVKTFEENAKEVELLIYELKSDIQKALECIKQLETKIVVQKKDDFMNKSSAPKNN